MNRAEGPPNEFEAGKPGTNARTAAEAVIESLRQKGGIFVEAVRATRMPMVLTDPNLPGNPIVFANEAFLKLSGYSMAEVLGQQPHFMNGRGTDPKDAARFAEMLRSEQDEILETVQYRKDGSRFVATVLLSAFKDEAGKTLNHFMSWLDVTRRADAETRVDELTAAHAALRESEQRLALVFKSLPVGVAIVDPSGTTLSMNDEMRRFLPTGRIPSRDPDRQDRWESYSPDGTKILPDDYPGARALRGEAVLPGIEMLYTPDDGRKVWTRVSSVPQFSPDGSVSGAFVTIVDIDAIKASEQKYRESEEQLRLIVEGARDYAIFTLDAEGTIHTWLPGAENVFGWSKAEAEGQPIAMTFTPEDRASSEHIKELKLARETGSAPNVRWHICKDGRRVFIDGRTVALRNERGKIDGFLKIGQDTTEKHRTSQTQAMLLAELQHRVRNTLAIVRSIARRTAQNSSSVEEMDDHLQGRIAAFSRVQALVTRAPGSSVPLRAIIEDELLVHAEHESDRIRLKGPDINFGAKIGESLSLAVHELATNSVKYGALAGDGEIGVTWSLVNDRFEFSWREKLVGEKLKKSTREGFGTELLLRAMPFDLQAETSLQFHDDGMEFNLSMPMPAAEPVDAAYSALTTGASG